MGDKASINLSLRVIGLMVHLVSSTTELLESDCWLVFLEHNLHIFGLAIPHELETMNPPGNVLCALRKPNKL